MRSLAAENRPAQHAGFVASQLDPQPCGPPGSASACRDNVPSRLHKRRREYAYPLEQFDSGFGRRPDQQAQRTAWPGSEQPHDLYRCPGAPPPRNWHSDRDINCFVSPSNGPLRQYLQHSEWTMCRQPHANRGSADGPSPEPRMGAFRRMLQSIVCHSTHCPGPLIPAPRLRE